MKISTIILASLTVLIACNVEQQKPARDYFDLKETNTEDYLLAVFAEDHYSFGISCGFVNQGGDTVISIGKYSLSWTDTFRTFAIVFDQINTDGNIVGIDKEENVLFDIVLFDNWPDELHDGLFRIKRNNKVGYANANGEVVIPCQYACAYWFEDGKAKVAFDCSIKTDEDSHRAPESDSWFYIDKKGNRIE